MMMLTITFCRCAHCNSLTSGTFSFLSKRRNIYRVLCTRFQFVYPDRPIPRCFRFHQRKIIFERIVIRSSPLEIHLNRKGQTKHSIRSLSTIFTLYKTLFTWRHGCYVGVPKPEQKPGPCCVPDQSYGSCTLFLCYKRFILSQTYHSCWPCERKRSIGVLNVLEMLYSKLFINDDRRTFSKFVEKKKNLSKLWCLIKKKKWKIGDFSTWSKYSGMRIGIRRTIPSRPTVTERCSDACEPLVPVLICVAAFNTLLRMLFASARKAIR